MTTPTPISVARAYREAWTNSDFGTASSLLSEELVVEVPMNDYPTKELFAAAVEGFARLVASTELLSEMSEGEEAMQLYDMQVEGLGTMRVVEHFTVRNGQIVRLRQIHDTAILRGGGAGGAA